MKRYEICGPGLMLAAGRDRPRDGGLGFDETITVTTRVGARACGHGMVIYQRCSMAAACFGVPYRRTAGRL